MKYDMCILGTGQDLDKLLDTAKELGWDGICLLADKKTSKKLTLQKKTKGLDVSIGLLIEPKNMNEMKRSVKLARKNYEVIAVRPSAYEMSRAVLETKEADILLGWESVGHPTDRVMDHVMVKLGAENNVSIAFSLQPLLQAYDKARAGIISRYLEASKFVKKYKAPFVVTSGSVSQWDMRSPSELTAFGNVIGFNGVSIKNAISERIVAENRKRLSGKWVMPGVELTA